MGPVLCLVSDRRRAGGVDALVALAGAASAAGVHLIQIREPALDGRALCGLVAACVAAVRGTRTRVLVNDRLDVAVAAGAHGVHLPGTGAPAGRVRAAAPPGFLIGRSVHRRDEAVQAAADGGLDYLVFGTVFESRSKAGGDAAGLEALREVAAAVPLPVLAIGGMDAERLGDVAGSGAAGIAAISLFAGQTPEGLQSLVSRAALAFGRPRADNLG